MGTAFFSLFFLPIITFGIVISQIVVEKMEKMDIKKSVSAPTLNRQE